MSAMEQAAAAVDVVVAILLIIGVEALYKRGTNIEYYYMAASLFLRRGHPHRNLIVSAVKSPKSRAPLAEKPHNKAPLGCFSFFAVISERRSLCVYSSTSTVTSCRCPTGHDAQLQSKT